MCCGLKGLVVNLKLLRHNKSPKPTLDSIAALRGSVSGGAAWLKRYMAK